MRNVRMDQHTNPLPPGFRTAGCHLVSLVLQQNVNSDRPCLCEDDDVEAAEVLGCVVQVKLGCPQPIDVPRYDADP